jgi:hypothetical protein
MSLEKIFENVTSVKKNLKFVGLSVSTINTYYKSNERKNDRKRLKVVLNRANTSRTIFNKVVLLSLIHDYNLKPNVSLELK